MAHGSSSARIYDTIELTLGSTTGRRCRIQGLGDASLHYGWIKEYANGSIVVEVKSKKPLKNGDFFFFEVSAPTNLLTFVGFVTKVTEQAITFKISSEIEERKLTTESRLKVMPFTGLLTGGIHTPEIRIIEISEEGFGFETLDPCMDNKFTGAILNSQQGSIATQVKIMHLRTDRETGDRRGGVKIKDMDRISKARWMRLFVE